MFCGLLCGVILSQLLLTVSSVLSFVSGRFDFGVLVMYTGGVLGAVFWLVRVRSFTLLLFCVMVVV